MINYLVSEKYRLFRRKPLYVSSGIFLMISSVITLMYKNMSDSFFESTWLFYFTNLLITVVASFFMVVIFNSLLMGKNDNVLKHAISFGISKPTIFLAKLSLSLSVFLGIILVSVVVTVILGEALFTADPETLQNYLVSLVNFLPLLISIFVLGYVLSLLQVSQIFVVSTLLLTYVLAGELLQAILSLFSKNEQISKYYPSNLIAEVVNQFMERRVSYMLENWLVSMLVVTLCLIIGLRLFNRKEF